jgi:hypothetical protein
MCLYNWFVIGSHDNLCFFLILNNDDMNTFRICYLKWTSWNNQSCRNLFPVCQTIGLVDVENVSDLSNICPTYNIFTTSTELHIYWLNPSSGLFTASSDTLEYSKLVQHIFVWHVEIYIQYNRLVYEINKDTKFA